MLAKLSRIKCYLIGSGNLAFECVKRVLGDPVYELRGIISPDIDLNVLANEHNIPFYSVLNDCLQVLEHDDFDYFFSVVNEQIIPLNIIKKARKAAINFHDSLLPRYAGLHATSWAILNQEKIHGVSWHQMTEVIDAGDIYKQEKIKIEANDTALILNMKCYELALSLFESLINDLKSNSIKPIAQNLTERTYYGYLDKPANGGYINFNQPSSNLYSLWRALYFGHHKNDFASCKLLINQRCFVVHAMKVVPAVGIHPPGQIIYINEDYLRIATQTEDVLITELRSLDGGPCSLLEFKEKTRLNQGDICEVSIDVNSAGLISKMNSVFMYEKFWVKEWMSVQQVNFPFFNNIHTKSLSTDYCELQFKESGNKKNLPSDWEDFLLALFAVYLFRITNKKSMSFGMLVNNDNMDIFSNIVPLNIQIDPADKFKDICSRISEQKRLIRNNQFYLLDIGYRYPELNEMSISYDVFYPILIEIQQSNKAIKNSGEYLKTPYFKVALDVERKKCQLSVGVSSEDDFTAKEFLERVSVHLHNIHDSMIADSNIDISTFSFLDPNEKQLLTPSSIDEKNKILQLSVLDHFNLIVKSFPDNVALISNQQSLTYKQLDNLSDQVAACILSHITEKKKQILLFMNQSELAIVSMLAVLKTNCIYVPFDPDNPKDRVQYILQDLSCALVLTNSLNKNKALNMVESLNIPVVDVSDVDCLSQFSLPKNYSVNIKPDDLAYILYTSGSTGYPKGVQIFHKSIVRLVKEQNYIDFKNDDVVAQFTTLSFDVSTFEIWGALLNGSSLYIIDKQFGFDPEMLSHNVKNGCTILFMTPSVFVEIFKSKPDTFDDLRVLILGGEALRSEDIAGLIKRKKSKGLQLEVINGYGPTENTTWSTCYKIDSLKKGRPGVPIGKTIAFSNTFVLDEYKNILPIGVPGELYLGGVGLAKGYLNKPKLTKESFIKLPLMNDKESRFYKTGDIVKMLPDGNLLFLGRNDDQIKIRGIRVELGEIESWLIAHPSVKQGAIVARKEKSRRYHLVAYVVPQGNNFNIDAIQRYLALNLPDYMVPYSFVVLNKLPLTMSNKVDRAKLPEPLPYDSKNYQAPRNEKEHMLAKIWSNILRAKQVGRNDNFFALGGDSIIAMQIITKINQEGWKVRASDIFNNPTIAKLASKLKSNKKTINKNTEIVEGKIPLTPIQSWFFETGYKIEANFSQSVLIKLNFVPSVDCLEKSFSALIHHHDLLRASFELEDGVWSQAVNNVVNPFKMYHQKLTGKKYATRISEMEAKLLNEYSEFELAKPPLIRGILFQGKSNFYLGIVAHHLVVDGLSWRILLDDLFMGYHTYANNNTIVLPMKSSSFQSWSDALLKYSQSKKLYKEYSFWEQQSCETDLPVDFKRGENIEKNAKSIVTELDLNQISLRYKQIRPIDILITALVLTLREWLSKSNVNFYIESHGRDSFDGNLDLSRTIGWFTSLYPIKFTHDDLHQNHKVLRVLKNVRRKYNQIQHHGMGFGLLKYMTDDPKMKKLMSEIKISPFCINFLGNFDAGISAGDFQFIGAPIRLMSAKSNPRPYLIDLSIWIKNEKLYMEWKYSANFYKSSTIQKLSATYLKNINMIVDECVNSVHQAFVSNDFPLVSLTQNQLNICINKYPNLENITRLSSLQSGLLFHRLQYPDSYIYHSQFIWQDNRGLDLALFKKAWETIVERHSIFRTNFLWKHFDHPIQVTDAYVNLPWKNYDCSTLSKKDQDAKVQAIIREDQERSFDFSEHPLMRVSVIKICPKSNVIVWTHHHILLGGWSINNVISEVYVIYKAYVNNLRYDLPQPIPYSEYIAYQSNKFNKKLSKKFWTNYLHDFKGTSVLSELGCKNTNLSPLTSQIEFIIPDEWAQTLKNFANESQVSMNTVMLYAWGLVISRYTNTTDFGVGVVVSTRPSDYFNTDDIVGPLINTLPFRFTLDPREKVNAVLHQINSLISNIAQYSHTALLDIYHWLKRNTQEPLFDTLFIFENYPVNFIDEYISNLIIKDTTHYPLVLSVFPNQKIQLIITYNKNALQKDIVQNIIKNYYSMLCEIISNKNPLASNVNILSDNEVAMLKKLVHKNKKIYPEDSIPSLFEFIAKKNSNKTAVYFKNEKVTYSELHKLSSQWASYLLHKGVKKGEAVAIYVDRSIMMVVSMLAVLKVGAIYVPIDISFPKERVNFIIKDASVKHVFTQASLLPNLKMDYHAIASDIFDDALVEDAETVLNPIRLSSTDLAYLIYTSGTTGLPKGIQVMHRSVVNAIYSIFNDIKVTSSDKLLSFTSIAFDISVLEIFGSLLWGMELEILSSSTINNPSLLTRCIQDSAPTIIQATPGFLQMILSAGWQNGRGIKILCGGEALSDELAQSILNTGASVWNMYGPSETTIWSTMSQVTPNKKISIGKPIANTAVYVLDNQQSLVPIGVTGELYIGGDGVSKGYVNRPDLTAKHFIQNPFPDTDYPILYRTGDLVRWTPEGDLEYVDRVDNQVKIRGYRVELDEIRSIILKHRNVQDAVVLKVGSSYEESRLVAFCILKDQKIPIANNELHITLSPYLPPYMVPDEFIILPSFSLDTNGKIDKKALMASYTKLHRKKMDQAALAKNPTEQLILKIFKKVLNSNHIDINDNFFELGGNSISAIQILSNIQECFSLSLSMHDILTLLTPSQIAQAIIHKKFHSLDSYEHIPSPIVCLQKKGDKPPLFLIHPVGGTIFWFVKLAALLGKERPIYAIQDPALFTEKAHFSTFEAMASFYANEIKSIQPSGPYFLAGASFGANMAAEIAKQFIGAGETVAFVGLLDGWGIYPDVVSTQNFLKKRMKAQYDDIKKKMSDVNTRNIKPIIDISWHRSHLLAAYHLDWIDCPLTLFKAEKTQSVFSDIESPHNHWLRYTPHLNVISVKGDHESMFFEPAVEYLAEKLNESIQKSEANLSGFHASQFKTSAFPAVWNQPSLYYPNMVVTSIFEAVVETDPSAFSVVYNGRCFTYEKLNNCANQLAHYLIDLGVSKGDVIGIHLDREFEMLIAVLGILKSGAAYAPINFAEPPSRVDNIQNFCRAVITQKNLLRKFNLGEKKTICIDRDWQFIRHKSTNNPNVEVNIDDVAIIMPSSASQVGPPGVIITHKNICNQIQWCLSEFTQDELIGVLASSPLGNELSIFEIFSPLCSGGAVHIVKTIQNLSDVPFSSNITLISTLPSYMNDLLKNKKIPKSVKTVILVNKYSDNALINSIYENTDIEKVFNVYLQTEVGILTSALLPRNIHDKLPIGKPIPNAKIYILNEHLEPVHVGTPGELYISGDVLSLGYINRPELMAEKFIDNPFDNTYKKLFRTGSLVSLGVDGNLYYLGSCNKELSVKRLYENTQEVEPLLES